MLERTLGTDLMLLSISTTYRPATDLGFLRHKNPSNVRTVELPFGPAHVFYPEAYGPEYTAPGHRGPRLRSNRSPWTRGSETDAAVR